MSAPPSEAPKPVAEAFRKALSLQSSPCSYGAFPVSPDDLILFYGKDDIARRLDFQNATEEKLKDLADACAPATFGRNTEEVLDETYRRAGVLDKVHFATHLDPASCGLSENIRDIVLEGHSKDASLRCELYKLNVYGPGSFFKPHKDTPRADNMIASLVVVLPTEHQGGELVFRCEKEEFVFDSAASLKRGSDSAQVAFATFFGDIEHEVRQVVSGYRVTITWNLYLVEKPSPTDMTLVAPGPFEGALLQTFRDFLDDESLLPHGGYLGFGLRHEYPVHASPDYWKPVFSPIAHVLKSLKGSDAVLYKICTELSLNVELQMVIWDGFTLMLCPGFPDLSGLDYDDCPFHRLRDKGGKCLNDAMDDSPDCVVTWVTDMRARHVGRIAMPYVEYGNSLAEIRTVYSNLVLIVTMGPPGDRRGPITEKDSDNCEVMMSHEGLEDLWETNPEL